ncbi:hypothetical protein PybrP1_012871 [[Pythium] brassicae (nom. inval.)]|nr:hypothetical protein PybrP1_012871 [[Pythium] brassicae (nom. inval.)]
MIELSAPFGWCGSPGYYELWRRDLVSALQDWALRAATGWTAISTDPPAPTPAPRTQKHPCVGP